MDAGIGVDREAVLKFEEFIAIIDISLMESDLSKPVDQGNVIHYFLEGKLGWLFPLPFVDGQSETAAIVSSLLEERPFLGILIADPAGGLMILRRAHLIIS